MSLDDEGRADYRDVFGKDPEPWREPLGALRLTLSDETEPPWTLERARAECEELVRVLNEAEVTDERIEAWDAIAQHPFFRECYATEDTLLNAMLEKLSVVATQLQAAQAAISRVVDAASTHGGERLSDTIRALSRADTSALAAVKAQVWDEGYWQGINGHTGAGNPYRDSGKTTPASIEQEGADR